MRVFKVVFINQGKVYEVYAKTVQQGELYGFVVIEGLLFGESSSIVVDPSEEKLKDEFAGVSRSFIPMHAVIRIDEVERQGQGKIHDMDGKTNVTPFPSAIYTPDKGSDK